MEIVYENGYYKVVANPYAHIYYVVNTSTEQVEGEEKALPTALYKADALKAVSIKRNQERGERDAAK